MVQRKQLMMSYWLSMRLMEQEMYLLTFDREMKLIPGLTSCHFVLQKIKTPRSVEKVMITFLGHKRDDFGQNHLE